MKLPNLDRLIVATLAEAYVIAVFFNVLHCKPSNFGEIASSTLAALVLAIPMVPITWAVLLTLFIPVYILMQVHQKARSKKKAQDDERTTTPDATTTEPPVLLKLPKREQLPAVIEKSKSDARPKSPQLPAISKTTTETKSPKTPQLPAVPQKSTLPKKID